MSYYQLDNVKSHQTFLISDSGDNLSYGDLKNINKEFSEVLEPRKIVFILCRNSIGSLVGLSACLQNSVVPLLLSSEINSEYLNDLINLYKPDYLYVPIETSGDFPTWTLIRNFFDYALLVFRNEECDLIHEELGLLLTTSGSTGSPKIVRLSYQNLISNSQSIAEYLDLSSQEKPITALPMNYSFGLSIINSHILSHATILLTNASITEKRFWRFFQENGATSLSGVPQTFEMLKRMKFFQMELPTLRTMTQAGGRLSDSTMQDFVSFCTNRGIAFFSMYGQTEASPRISYVPPSVIKQKIGSIGIAIPGGELSLIDPSGNQMSDSFEIGELCYQGPNVCLGYANNRADLSKGNENRGILNTGDYAYRDKDGYYYIRGRKDRFIKVFGNRINLDDVEQLLHKFEDSCACIGTEDLISIFTTSKLQVEQLRSEAAKLTGLNRLAFRVFLLDVIPINKSGKINYAELALRANA